MCAVFVLGAEAQESIERTKPGREFEEFTVMVSRWKLRFQVVNATSER
jgi:hypothetical protein